MKNNTGRAKGLIIEAIKNMPNDFALSETRTYLNWALSSLEKVENKRMRRMEMNQNIAKIQAQANEATQIRQPMAQVNRQLTVEELSVAMNQIDNMIAAEKRKLEGLKPQLPSNQTTDIQAELDQFKSEQPRLLRD